MDVTSHHLEVVADFQNQGRDNNNPNDVISDGEELSKRGEDFGHPVGKRESAYTIARVKHPRPTYIPIR